MIQEVERIGDALEHGMRPLLEPPALGDVDESPDAAARLSGRVEEGSRILQQPDHAAVVVNDVEFRSADFPPFTGGNLHGQLVVGHLPPEVVEDTEVGGTIPLPRGLRGVGVYRQVEGGGKTRVDTDLPALAIAGHRYPDRNDPEQRLEVGDALLEIPLELPCAVRPKRRHQRAEKGADHQEQHKDQRGVRFADDRLHAAGEDGRPTDSPDSRREQAGPEPPEGSGQDDGQGQNQKGSGISRRGGNASTEYQRRGDRSDGDGVAHPRGPLPCHS